MPPHSILRAAHNPFLDSFVEAADSATGAIRSQAQWDRFVRLLVAPHVHAEQQRQKLFGNSRIPPHLMGCHGTSFGHGGLYGHGGYGGMYSNYPRG